MATNNPNPAGLEEIEREKRDANRRAKNEADKAAADKAREEAAADEKIAAAREQKRKLDLQPEVEKHRNLARKTAQDAREEVVKLQERINKRLAAIGDLEGAVITAGDVAKNDPDRALASLARATKAFAAFK